MRAFFVTSAVKLAEGFFEMTSVKNFTNFVVAEVNMNPVIIQNIESIKDICRRHKVSKLYAFGSVCTDKFNVQSDIDFIVAFKFRFFDGYVDNFLSLEKELEETLKHEVDLVAEETLINPYFIKVVNQTKTPVYE